MLPTPSGPGGVFRWLLGILIALVFLFGLMAVTVRERPAASAVEEVVTTSLYPLQSATAWVVGRVRSVAGIFADVGELRKEVARLRMENAELRYNEILNQIVAAENRKLRHELSLRQDLPYQLLAATVLVRDANTWFQEVVIDRGTREGVREGMAVVNYQGLVGVVVRPTWTTSTVRLVLDQDFGISATTVGIQGRLEFGVVRGRGSDAEVEVGQNPVAALSVGDRVVTSGLGTKVPKNLYIGTVQAVAVGENNLLKVGIIDPGVDFSRLDFVQVVMTAKADAAESVP